MIICLQIMQRELNSTKKYTGNHYFSLHIYYIHDIYYGSSFYGKSWQLALQTKHHQNQKFGLSDNWLSIMAMDNKRTKVQLAYLYRNAPTIIMVGIIKTRCILLNAREQIYKQKLFICILLSGAGIFADGITCEVVSEPLCTGRWGMWDCVYEAVMRRGQHLLSFFTRNTECMYRSWGGL